MVDIDFIPFIIDLPLYLVGYSRNFGPHLNKFDGNSSYYPEN